MILNKERVCRIFSWFPDSLDDASESEFGTSFQGKFRFVVDRIDEANFDFVIMADSDHWRIRDYDLGRLDS